MEQLTNFIENLSTIDVVNIIIAIAIIAIFNIILSPILSYIILKLFNLKQNRKQIKENTFYTSIKVFFNVTAIYIAILFLKPTFNLTDDTINIIKMIYKVIVTITIANSLANSITKKSRIIETIKDKSDKDINDNTTKMLVRIVRFVIYAVAAFIVFAEIGYDLSGLVTGLGLGTVVLTLAAQSTITDIVSGVLIAMDKPFIVGDFIKCGELQGTVEDITFRSTRIRSLDDTIINIPNSTITSSSIENYNKMKRRRYLLELELEMGTQLDDINKLEERIYSLLINNEYIIKDTINIHFTEISANGFKMVIVCYFNIVSYMEFLDVKEELHKNIIDILNKQNVKLAYDTKTIELKK